MEVKFLLECIGAVLTAVGCWMLIAFGAMAMFEHEGFFAGLFLVLAGMGGLLNNMSAWRQFNDKRRNAISGG